MQRLFQFITGMLALAFTTVVVHQNSEQKKGGDDRVPLITLKARIHTDLQTEAVLKDAMYCATKVYNGLLWHLRKEYEETGKVDISRRNLNRILKELPRAKGYYSMSVQLTRDEVWESYKSFSALKEKGLTQHETPGFRRKGYLSPHSRR